MGKSPQLRAVQPPAAAPLPPEAATRSSPAGGERRLVQLPYRPPSPRSVPSPGREVGAAAGLCRTRPALPRLLPGPGPCGAKFPRLLRCCRPAPPAGSAPARRLPVQPRGAARTALAVLGLNSSGLEEREIPRVRKGGFRARTYIRHPQDAFPVTVCIMETVGVIRVGDYFIISVHCLWKTQRSSYLSGF